MQKVEVPVEYQKEEGCVAFQLVKVVIDFYGKLIEDVLDTKILQNWKCWFWQQYRKCNLGRCQVYQVGL